MQLSRGSDGKNNAFQDEPKTWKASDLLMAGAQLK